ncbi:MAG: AEC family transporter [Raineya sp.]
MSNFLIIFAALLAGFILRRFANILSLPLNAHQGVNVFVLYVSLPAMALYYVPKIHFSWQVALPLSVGGIVLLGSVLFFGIASILIKYKRGVLGALIMSCGFGNVSFLGYPLVEAYYGKEAIQTAVLIDQGTFLVLAVMGIPLAMLFAGKEISAKVVFKKLLFFPSFGAFLVALLCNFFNFEFPDAFQVACKRFADALTPLALFSVAWQIRLRNLGVKWHYWVLGFFYKLFLAPIILYFLVPFPLTLAERVVVLQAAMAPMITSSLIAVEQGLEPPLANFLVSIGIPLSFLSTWIWWYLLA